MTKIYEITFIVNKSKIEKVVDISVDIQSSIIL
jgi:hypothetical protein